MREAAAAAADDLPSPVPGAGEALVAIEAAAVSQLDLQVIEGRFPVRPPLPFVPGTDAAGRVVSGDGVAPGQRVWVRGAGLGVARDGCWAEHAVVPTSCLHPLAEDVDAAVAATFFVPCMAAHVALHDVGMLREGERVAVRGAAGAVGSLAVQMALAAGASEVLGIVATRERAAAVPQGARPIVAPDAAALATLAKTSVDLLVDTVGGDGLAASVAMMAQRGRIVVVGYGGGTSLMLDLLALLVQDVSILPVNGMSRAPEVTHLADGWLDDLRHERLAMPVTAFGLDALDDALRLVRESPSPGRVALRLG